VRKVVKTNMLPVIDTAMAHKNRATRSLVPEAPADGVLKACARRKIYLN
jgi:hypothetical protein